MAGLRDLQRDFQQFLIGQESPIAAVIVDAPPLPPAERLGIYRHAYEVRLIDALDNTYSALHALLGDETFFELGSAFVAAHPSVYRSIRWYGRELPAFLRDNAPYHEHPVLSEVALLEWTLSEVFDAPDTEPLTRAALRAVDPGTWSELKFRFHPSLRRLEFAWNSVAVWQAMSADETPPAAQRSAEPLPWLLWRQNLQNYFRSMTPAEVAALDAAVSGESFAQICAALSDFLPDEEIPLTAANFLGTWADSGIIVALN